MLGCFFTYIEGNWGIFSKKPLLGLRCLLVKLAWGRKGKKEKKKEERKKGERKKEKKTCLPEQVNLDEQQHASSSNNLQAARNATATAVAGTTQKKSR